MSRVADRCAYQYALQELDHYGIAVPEDCPACGAMLAFWESGRRPALCTWKCARCRCRWAYNGYLTPLSPWLWRRWAAWNYK